MRLSPVVFLGSALLAGFGLALSTAGLPSPPAPSPAVGSPEWIVDRFFVQKEFPEVTRYATGEFAELYKDSPTLGSILPSSVSVRTRVLEREAASAIFGISITDGNVTKEWYAYLRNQAGTFKLEAIRTLTLGGNFFENLKVAEQAAAAGNLSESGLQEFDRFHLIIASDARLKTHFLAQQALFEALERDFEALVSIDAVSLDGEVSPAGGAGKDQVLGLAQQLRALRLGAVIRKFRGCDGCVILKIGGDGESQVGYLHAPAGARVPKMSPRNFIYVEPIASGWYLFKTV